MKQLHLTNTPEGQVDTLSSGYSALFVDSDGDTVGSNTEYTK